MKVFGGSIILFAIITAIPAGIHEEQNRTLEQRAATATRDLRHIYATTPNQSFRIVYANAWMGNVCIEYVTDDARQQSTIGYAVFEKGSKFVNYSLDKEDIEDRCNAAGVDVSHAAERGLEDK